MNVQEAAAYIGIAPRTIYKWKRQALANRGFLILGGIAVRFRFRQTGAAGQGRILFERQWLDEIKRAMEGEPLDEGRKPRPASESLPHVNVTLGVPPC